MRIGFVTGMLVRYGSIVCASGLTACQTPDANPGRLRSLSLGTLAGLFHRVSGRWPFSIEELSATPCPDFDDFPAADLGDSVTPQPARTPAACEFAATFPYQTTLTPVSADLRVNVRQADGTRVCDLTVIAPPAGTGTEITPQVRIKMSAFSCPGEGK